MVWKMWWSWGKWWLVLKGMSSLSGWNGSVWKWCWDCVKLLVVGVRCCCIILVKVKWYFVVIVIFVCNFCWFGMVWKLCVNCCFVFIVLVSVLGLIMWWMYCVVVLMRKLCSLSIMKLVFMVLVWILVLMSGVVWCGSWWCGVICRWMWKGMVCCYWWIVVGFCCGRKSWFSYVSYWRKLIL